MNLNKIDRVKTIERLAKMKESSPNDSAEIEEIERIVGDETNSDEVVQRLIDLMGYSSIDMPMREA